MIARRIAGAMVALGFVTLLVWYFWPTPLVMIGRPVAEGEARLLTASPHGDALAWLSGCVKRGDAWVECDVMAYRFGTAELTRVGSGAASSRPPRWSSTGELAVLVNLDASGGKGELRTWSTTGGLAEHDEKVSEFHFSPSGVLLYVADGVAYARSQFGRSRVGREAAPIRQLEPCPAADGPVVALALTEARELLAIETCRATRLAANVAAFAFSGSGRFAFALTEPPEGELRAIALDEEDRVRQLGARVRSFSPSPVGDAVAFEVENETALSLELADLEGSSDARGARRPRPLPQAAPRRARPRGRDPPRRRGGGGRGPAPHARRPRGAVSRRTCRGCGSGWVVSEPAGRGALRGRRPRSPGRARRPPGG